MVGRDPLLVLDGAHNPAACAVLVDALEEARAAGECKRLCIVLGFLEDKEMMPILERLLPQSDHLIVTRGRSDRFRDPGAIASSIGDLGRDASVTSDVSTAIDSARRWARAADCICVCGSLYLVGDALDALGMDPFGMVRDGS